MSSFWEKIKEISQNVWEICCSIFEEVTSFFGRLFDKLVDLFENILEGIWYTTETVVKAAANGIAYIITRVYTPSTTGTPKVKTYQVSIPVDQLPPPVRAKYEEAKIRGEINITAEREQLLDLQLGNLR